MNTHPTPPPRPCQAPAPPTYRGSIFPSPCGYLPCLPCTAPYHLPPPYAPTTTHAPARGTMTGHATTARHHLQGGLGPTYALPHRYLRYHLHLCHYLGAQRYCAYSIPPSYHTIIRVCDCHCGTFAGTRTFHTHLPFPHVACLCHTFVCSGT